MSNKYKKTIIVLCCVLIIKLFNINIFASKHRFNQLDGSYKYYLCDDSYGDLVLVKGKSCLDSVKTYYKRTGVPRCKRNLLFLDAEGICHCNPKIPRVNNFENLHVMYMCERIYDLTYDLKKLPYAYKIEIENPKAKDPKYAKRKFKKKYKIIVKDKFIEEQLPNKLLLEQTAKQTKPSKPSESINPTTPTTTSKPKKTIDNLDQLVKDQIENSGIILN